MVIKINKSTECLLVYACFLLAYCIQTSRLVSQFSHFIYFFYLLGYTLGVSKLLTESFPRKNIYLILLLILTGLCVFCKVYCVGIVNALQPFNLFFMIICMKGLDFDRIVKFDLVTKVLCTIVLYVLSTTGLIQNLVTTRSNGIIRYAYGYAHANRLGAAIFLICLYIFYLRRGKRTIFDLIYPLLGTWITYRATNSRTSSIGMIIIFFVNAFLFLKNSKARDAFSKWQSTLVKIGITGLIALIFGITLFYKSEKMSFLNELLTGRIKLGNIFWHFYKITLFGSQTQIYSWSEVLSGIAPVSNVGIDILYLMVLFRYGIITFALYIYMIFWILNYALKRDKILAICFSLICVISCVENQFFSAPSNIFMLLFSYRLFGPHYAGKDLESCGT